MMELKIFQTIMITLKEGLHTLKNNEENKIKFKKGVIWLVCSKTKQKQRLPLP